MNKTILVAEMIVPDRFASLHLEIFTWPYQEVEVVAFNLQGREGQILFPLPPQTPAWMTVETDGKELLLRIRPAEVKPDAVAG